MKRTILVALGTGALISSAAALTLGAAPANLRVADNDVDRARIEAAAREAHREAIEARYRIVRTQCDALNGARHDECLIAAHAFRGGALMQAHAPYARN